MLPELGVSAFGGDASAGDIAQIVANDLVLADIAALPKNQAGAEAAAAKDRASGQVNPEAWTAAGVTYVLRGQAGGGSAQAELYDAISGQRLLGKSYANYNASTPRLLAHRMADDIMQAITKRPGIFSSQIAFLSATGGGNKEVAVMDADGEGARRVTRENALVASPAWGMNGTEIYFTSYRENNPDLYGITLDGRRFEVSRRPGLNTSPSWSAPLQRLAVTLAKDGNSEIYTMSREGRDLARLTNNPDVDTAPEWSPDGRQIAFTSARSGVPQIYIMNSSGGGARLASHGGYCDSPTWSPDGSRLAYVARESGEFNIYMLDIGSGGPAVQLTRGQRDNRDPSWGPSSRHLAFSSNRTGRDELFMMNTDTKQAKQLTRTGGATSPAWGPARAE